MGNKSKNQKQYIIIIGNLYDHHQEIIGFVKILFEIKLPLMNLYYDTILEK